MPARYQVVIQEFIPRDQSESLLEIAGRLDALVPVDSNFDVKDVKRALAWMGKYHLPTAEFWDWERNEVVIESDAVLGINLIGIGWTVIIGSTKWVELNQILIEERRLLVILDTLTSGVTTEAVLRVRSARWDVDTVSRLAKWLRARGYGVSAQGYVLRFSKLDADITLEPEGERLRFRGLTREKGEELETVLRALREFANVDFQGSNWCAYQRRRLTIIRRTADGDEAFGPAELRIVAEPSKTLVGEIAADGRSWLLAFPRSRYHEGGIHPRALVTYVAAEGDFEQQSTFETYLHYLWVAHYSRIWLYLLFEDIYAYINQLRVTRGYHDAGLADYWGHIAAADDLTARLQTHIRTDRGEVQSYRPPHDRFSSTAEIAAHNAPVQWLRDSLIYSTVSDLIGDPLERCAELLQDSIASLKAAYLLFSFTISNRIADGLRVLQAVFVIAAGAAILTLLPLGSLAVDGAANVGANMPHVSWLVAWLRTGGEIGQLNLLTANLILLLSLAWLGMWVLRLAPIRSAVRRLIE